MTNLFDLTGKVSIVTGGNGGIGKAIALGLAEYGSDIVIAARNEKKTEDVVKQIFAKGRHHLCFHRRPTPNWSNAEGERLSILVLDIL